MKPVWLILIAFTITSLTVDFKSEQLKSARVKKAYDTKEVSLKELYESKGLNFQSQQIFIRAFKKERALELWARSDFKGKFKLVKTFDFCYASGGLGPKRKYGDNQVPEGFYVIDRHNPWSDYHLSLGINYPNESDKILSNKKNPGGDIFIHGKCVSIGCIAITDDKIEELYIAAVEARNKGQQKIPVFIFPFRMTEENMENMKEAYSDYAALISFWNNLKTGYDYFEKNKTLPVITVKTDGKYSFKPI